MYATCTHRCKDFNNLIYQRAVWRETFMYGSVQGQLNDRM